MSFSDDSDLTDLSSDEENVPLAPTRKPQTRSKKPLIRPALRAPRTVSYSVESLYKKLCDKSLDLEPEYQRDVVWSDSKQSQLIDSLIHNYYIPPLIFAVSLTPEGEEKRTCIDGKQRLSSIRRFTDGHIMHKDSVTQGKFWYISGAGRTRSRTILPMQLKSRFSNTQITCVEYDDLTQDQEREIFRRVQLGVALTPAERLQAITGPLASLIREVQDKLASPEGLEGHVPWGKARGRDFLCVAQIIYLIDGKKAEPSAPKIEAWLTGDKAATTITPKLKRNIDSTVDVLCTLARDPALSKPLNDKKVSPIEFVMITYMIFLHRDKLSLTQLSDAAAQLRKNVRGRFSSIRSNTETYNHVLGWLKTMKTLTFKSDGEGDRPASQCTRPVKEVVPHQPSTKPTTAIAKGKETATGRKRRRVVAEESEAENRPPAKAKAKPARKRAVNPVQSTTTPSSSNATQPLTTTSLPQIVVTPDQTSPSPVKITSPPPPSSSSTKPKTTTKPKIPAIPDDALNRPQLATPRKKRPGGSSIVIPPPEITALPTPDPTPVVQQGCPWTAPPHGSQANPWSIDYIAPVRAVKAKLQLEAARRGSASTAPPSSLRESDSESGEERRSRSRSSRDHDRRRGRSRSRSRLDGPSGSRRSSRSRSRSRSRYSSRRSSRTPERCYRRGTRSRSSSPRCTRSQGGDSQRRGAWSC